MKHLCFLTLLALVVFISCHKNKAGGEPGFKTMKLDELTATNAPEGIVLRDSMWQPASGWEILTSKDGTKAMVIKTGGDEGGIGFECTCNSGSGACRLRPDIIMCIPAECSDCSTTLKIYDRLIKINRANW